jgi:hypothetical protein
VHQHPAPLIALVELLMPHHFAFVPRLVDGAEGVHLQPHLNNNNNNNNDDDDDPARCLVEILRVSESKIKQKKSSFCVFAFFFA